MPLQGLPEVVDLAQAASNVAGMDRERLDAQPLWQVLYKEGVPVLKRRRRQQPRRDAAAHRPADCTSEQPGMPLSQGITQRRCSPQLSTSSTP